MTRIVIKSIPFAVVSKESPVTPRYQFAMLVVGGQEDGPMIWQGTIHFLVDVPWAAGPA